MRLALAGVALFATSCTSVGGLHSARAVGAGTAEAQLKLGAQTQRQNPIPLEPDRHVDTTSFDLGIRGGMGDRFDLLMQIGLSGIELGALTQLTDPAREHFALAFLVETRGRVEMVPGSSQSYLDLIASVPIEWDPHPRLALILEPRGLLTLEPLCDELSSREIFRCRPSPLHAAISGGGRFRLSGGFVAGAELTWLPVPVARVTDLQPGAPAWEASLLVQWSQSAN